MTRSSSSFLKATAASFGVEFRVQEQTLIRSLIYRSRGLLGFPPSGSTKWV